MVELMRPVTWLFWGAIGLGLIIVAYTFGQSTLPAMKGGLQDLWSAITHFRSADYPSRMNGWPWRLLNVTGEITFGLSIIALIVCWLIKLGQENKQ